jgi:hypothetical protein
LNQRPSGYEIDTAQLSDQGKHLQTLSLPSNSLLTSSHYFAVFGDASRPRRGLVNQLRSHLFWLVFDSATGGRCCSCDKTIEGCRTRNNTQPNGFLLGSFVQEDLRPEKQIRTDKNRSSSQSTLNIEQVDFPGHLQKSHQVTGP